MIKRCLICGKEFTFYPCYERLGRGKYCSRKCCGKAQRTAEKRKCLFCGKEFNAFQSQIKLGLAKYCSIKCYNLSRTGTMRECPVCHKEFYSYRSDERYHRGRCCSWKCHKEWARGKNHWNWQGGKSFEPYSLDWTGTLKRSIRERDHYACQLCGKPQVNIALDIHHIDYDKKNCNPNNLVALCHRCHTKTGRNRDYWIKYFSS